MADEGFNKTTVGFNNVTYTALLNTTRGKTAKTVDVGGCGDTDVENVGGRVDHSFSIEVIGYAVPTLGTKSTLTITWNSGRTDTITNVLLVGAEETGAIDDKISMKLTFVKGVS